MISRIRLISLLFSIIFVLSISREAESQYLGYHCRNNAYDPNVNITYRAYLNALLSNLSEASRTKDFYSFQAGKNTSDFYRFREGTLNFNRFQAGKDTTEPTNGLYLCRGDVTRELCHSCVQNAWTDILISCPNQKVAINWYDYCMLRYSNRSIISLPDQSIILTMTNTGNVTAGELAGFNEALGKMMDEIATRAAKNSSSGKKFATQEGNYSHFGKLYTLAQCTPDLSTDQCDDCLREAIRGIPRCCGGKWGGTVLYPSCNIRYDTYKFYNIADNAPSPSPSPLQPPSDVANNPPITSPKKGKRLSVAVIIIIIVVPIIISVVLFVLSFLSMKKRSKEETYGVVEDEYDISLVESIQYSFSEIQAATNNFSVDHKIGEGGFGHVYKGTLPNGKIIAVKRLSKTSLQGVEEFKNEISLVAKLQHRNLVRLLGFSFRGEEKILVYEFVPNKSLNYFLFDPKKQSMLDWSRRKKIITGIARGLLYLHEDSRLKIIHRDLKASNILLDQNMNPKIADFGMARIFRVDQSEEQTNRIAGTYGYMSPEYAMHGQFSVKSDVYSFGVLILEIISCKRNSNFCQFDLGEDSLLSYAWKKWKDGTLLDLVDEQLGDSNYSRNEILQCIHVGLLCVQEDVEQRPTMASVVSMLSSRSITLPAPRHPPFFAISKTEPSRSRMDMEETDKSTTTTMSVPASVNETSITELYPR